MQLETRFYLQHIAVTSEAVLTSSVFYPEISGFFEAVGSVLGSYFKIEISGFFRDF